MASEPLIRNVSDTARWVAVYRAQESSRPDALFHDPFAERLAGERGRAIAATVPPQARSGWPMVTRTKVIDDLVVRSIADGCERVLCLAAGFDTRPYRMALPESLEWVEADLPAIIDEKESLLEGEEPRCRLRRERVDLADASARDGFLRRATEGARDVLVITEGLLPYLADDDVRALGRALHARGEIRWWILDLMAPAIARMLERGMQLGSAPMRFAPAEGVAFVEALGWRARDIRSMLHEAVRYRRAPMFLWPFGWLPAPDPRRVGRTRWSAVVRYER
jgi:methyltransferase (TIGR00027 family)